MINNRTKLINYCINKFRYESYLEIGCRDNQNYDQINVIEKIGVDPEKGGTHRMTSDVFFEHNIKTFDIIFIDGLHISDQVDKDIVNSVNILNKNGTIILHDCNPKEEINQLQKQITSKWNGDVWKSFVKQRSNHLLDMATGNFDHGCGVIRIRENTDYIDSINLQDYTWKNFSINRNKWLRLMSYDDLIKWI